MIEEDYSVEGISVDCLEAEKLHDKLVDITNKTTANTYEESRALLTAFSFPLRT